MKTQRIQTELPLPQYEMVEQEAQLMGLEVAEFVALAVADFARARSEERVRAAQLAAQAPVKPTDERK